ncbi:hypothetical protein CMI42_04305 [Candidatus Pacearchaeota archaeon]|nr:hypothetical protein [Candidatus Pacearchaeota archaeon]|tara:strand:- start:215 stop:706 length:492 start_codon:yes stop_codon:yes gene_type:complete
MVEPIFITPYFLDYVLPLVLVFTLIFAILQKTQLLGEDKKQIDALVGLVVGLILIAFPGPRSIVVLLMPFLAVSAVILLVFMLLYGFIANAKDGNVLGDYWKWAFGAILFVALVSFLLMITGYWDFVWDLLFRGRGGQIFATVVMVVIIAGAIIAVIRGGGSS